MKVLFTFGGLPHYYNLVLNKLNRIPGLDICVVVPEEKGRTLGAGVYESIEGIEFNVFRLKERKAWYGKAAFEGFSTLLRRERPDAIVTVWPYVLSFMLDWRVRLAVRNLGIKLIYKDIPFNIPKYHEAKKFFREQGVQIEKMGQNRNTILRSIKYHIVTEVIRGYLKMMDAHVYYTEDALDIIPTYGVSRDKIFIIYNSPDTDVLLKVREDIQTAPPILPANAYRLLHVGRLVKWKRVDLLIDVFCRLKAKFKDAQLVIIGNGPEEESLKRQADESGFADSIVFTGAIYDTATLGRYFEAASIYVLAGMGGLSINEAMAFGKPVVCSIADGTEKALVREDYNGKYFKNGDAGDLYEKIDYLLSNQALIKKFGDNSLSIIRNEINIHTVINGYVDAFNYVSHGRMKQLVYDKNLN